MQVGDTVGAYILESKLGSGLMGSTWIASRAMPRDEERVVLKILDMRATSGWTGVDLFRREAEALKTLSHPGIPRCVEYFEDASASRTLLVLVMEFVEGTNLQKLVDSGRRFTDVEVEGLLAGLADILAYLGSLRPPFVHRDVTPKNLMLRPDGSVALVDFSGVQDALRDASSPGATLVGTAGYTPIEQVSGHATPRSDLYGAAATALFLLSGRNPSELRTRAMKPDLASFPDLSPRLAYVLDSWLEPDELRRSVNAAKAAIILRGEAALPASRDAHAATGGHALGDAGSVEGQAETPATLPSDSKLLIERSPEKLRIFLPAAGFRSGPQNLVGCGFTGFWLAFVAFWTYAAVAMGAPIFFAFFSLPFWAVGLYLARMFIKRSYGSAELIIDEAVGLAYGERLFGAWKRKSWPLSDAGACSLQDSIMQGKGGHEHEIALVAGSSTLRFGRGLCDRELRAMRDAINTRLGDFRRSRGTNDEKSL